MNISLENNIKNFLLKIIHFFIKIPEKESKTMAEHQPK